MDHAPGPHLSARSSLADVFRLSAPIVPAMLSQMLLNFFDGWMVSQIGVAELHVGSLRLPLDTVVQAGAGKAALAAIGPALFSFIVLMALPMGIAGVVNTFASQALGRGEHHEAGRYTWQAVHLALASIAVVVVVNVLAEPLFSLIAPDPQVRQLETSYFTVRSWSLPAAIATTGFNAFFQGIHRPALQALVAIAVNLLNLVLNWMLIYGQCSMPRMGIAGAAWATNIATVAGLIVMAALFLGPATAKRFATRVTWQPDWARFRRFLVIGAPAGGMFLLDVIGWSLLMVVIANRLGETSAAATNAALMYLQIGFMPVVGVAMAVTVLVGKAIGDRRFVHATDLARAGFAVGGIYQLAIGVGMVLLRRELMDFFSDDPEVIALGAKALIFAGIFQAFDALGIVYNGALRGAGDTKFPVIATLALMLCLFAPVSLTLAWWLLPPGVESLGPWIAGSIYVIALGFVLLWRWRSGHWRRIDIFSPA